MTVSSTPKHVSNFHPVIVIPAVGMAAWFAAGLLPGNETTPAQAMPKPGIGSSASGARGSLNSPTLPDRMPNSLYAPAPTAIAPPAYAYAAPSSGGSAGTGGGSSGGGDGSANSGQSKHDGQPGHAGREALKGDHGHDHTRMQAQHGSQSATPRNGPATVPHASQSPRTAMAAPPVAPPVYAAPRPMPFPFFGGMGGHFTPHATFGGGHFGGGGGRHR